MGMLKDKWPTEEEWRVAGSWRSLSTWMVFRSYKIQNGVLKPAERSFPLGARFYLPVLSPAIVGEIGRLLVGERLDAIAFAKRWGVLGYLDILGPNERASIPSDSPEGDPLGWVWAHVRGIQVVLDLHRLLRRDATRELEQYLGSLNTPDGTRDAVEKANRALREHDFAEVLKVTESLLRFPDLFRGSKSDSGLISGRRQHIVRNVFQPIEDDPRAQARGIIALIINPNLVGVYNQIGERQEGKGQRRLELASSFDSLLSVIYWHLARIVTGETVRECAECGMPFLVQDGRQRFCPSGGTGESLCALRHRQRKLKNKPVVEEYEE